DLVEGLDLEHLRAFPWSGAFGSWDLRPAFIQGIGGNFHCAAARHGPAGASFHVGSIDLNQWFIYLVRSRPGHLYTGITTDVGRRLREHEAGRTGARSLRGKAPLTLAFSAPA